MTAKALKIQVDFNIHLISCPGVWLDSLEDVWLTIEMFGETHVSTRFVPVFPVYVFENHKFDRVFVTCFDPSEACDLLEGDHMHIKLMQKSYIFVEDIVLAKFDCNTRSFLYPQPKLGPIYSRSQRELLMERTRHFRGTIAPKLEFSVTSLIKSSHLPLRMESQYACDSPRICQLTDGGLISRDLQIESLEKKGKCQLHHAYDLVYPSYTIPVFTSPLEEELAAYWCRKCELAELDRMELEEEPRLLPPLRSSPPEKQLQEKLKKNTNQSNVKKGKLSVVKEDEDSLDSESNSDEDFGSYFGDTYKRAYELERYF